MADDTSSTSIDAALARQYDEDRLHLATEILLPAVLNERDRWAALRVINICGEAVRDGVELPKRIAVWLADVLKSISEGDSIEEACGIPVRHRGAKKEGQARVDADRQFKMAYFFGVRHKYEKVKALAARKEIAILFDRKQDAVKAAWMRHRQEVLREIALDVECFGAPWPVRYRSKGYRDRDLITPGFAG